MRKKGDALQALIAEQVDLEVEYDSKIDIEQEASRESIAARQVLDTAIEKRRAVNQRLEHTKEAVSILMIRDEVSRETIDALLGRERVR
jgi:hypothetical protein